MESEAKKMVVIFIDLIARKNILQLEAINKFGLQSYSFVSQKNKLDYEENYNIKELKRNFFLRCWQILYFFLKVHKKVHHIEVYPGGRITFLYILFAKIFFLNSICCERGDLLHINDKKYSALTRFSMKCCYRMADIVWYRELYMRSILEKLKVKKKFFFHNSVEVPNWVEHEKTIDFVWANRIIKERNAEWFVEVMGSSSLLRQKAKGVLIGFLTKIPLSVMELQDYLLRKKPENLEYIDYSNPSPWFLRSKFFVLPSTIVFANHSLLEAMSYGVVPIVSNVSGAELIVENNVNGFVFNHDKNSFLSALEKALLLSDAEYKTMSQRARQKIISEFSVEAYEKNLRELYNRVN